MAKVKIKGLLKLEASLRRKFQKFLDETKVIGDELLDDLKDEIKDGTSPATGKPFKALAKSTIDKRRKMAKYNSTDSSFSPTKSALTFSGQLVDSIKSNVKILAKSVNITIEATGKRKPYKNKDGSNTKGSAKVGNKKLAEIHSKGNASLPKRDIVNISRNRTDKIVKRIKEALLKSIK